MCTEKESEGNTPKYRYQMDCGVGILGNFSPIVFPDIQ